MLIFPPKKSKLKKAFVLSNIWVFCSVNKLFSWSSSIFDHLYYCVLVWVVLKTDSSDRFLKKKINWDYFDVPIISVINTYMEIDFIWKIPYYLDFSLLQKYCKWSDYIVTPRAYCELYHVSASNKVIWESLMKCTFKSLKRSVLAIHYHILKLSIGEVAFC